jgi:hypothetical protein
VGGRQPWGAEPEGILLSQAAESWARTEGHQSSEPGARGGEDDEVKSGDNDKRDPCIELNEWLQAQQCEWDFKTEQKADEYQTTLTVAPRREGDRATTCAGPWSKSRKLARKGCAAQAALVPGLVDHTRRGNLL